jgi:anti-sigma28 factor (negative regulator of flagellin synthesis)
MSIRIQNDSLAGTGASGVGRADEISRPASSPIPSPGRSGPKGGDSVDISSLSQSVAAASTAQDAQQTGRIARLSALYRSGQYSIDSAQVSQAMVSQALGGGAGEND